MASNNSHVAFAPVPVTQQDDNNRPLAQVPISPPIATPVAPTPGRPPTTPYPSTVVAIQAPQGPYKDGFSTSICEGLFADPFDRTSCCALTCCATLTQDRNRYIVTGELPRHLWGKRIVGGLVAVIVLPLWLGHFILVWIGALVGFGVYATNQRHAMRMRIMQEYIQHGAERDPNQLIDGCGCINPRKVHRMCSCVSKDKLSNDPLSNASSSVYSTIGQEGSSPMPSSQGDICTQTWKTIAILCCGCCGCWYNCWGACATAQEERELRRRLGKERFHLDMITMQSWSDYYPALQNLRQQTNYSFLSHLGALSKLAKTILSLFSFFLAIIALIILLRGHEEKLVVVGGTLGQSLLVLYLVHWRKHRLDLSLDAVIKLFGSGFCFATGIAMIVEAITSALGYILFLIVVVFEIAEEDPSNIPSADDDNPNDMLRFLQHFAKEHIITFAIFTAFKAFIVAGVSEEFSKYFCFWMVEHPDFPDERDDDGDAASEKGVHSTAAAITCGLVSTAAGFACAENFLYVFGAGLTLSGEIEILLLRSCFPIHPICAAIQSIGICRRDVEKDSTQLGQAILPAVLLHGTFDFAIFITAVLNLIREDIPEEMTLAPLDDSSGSLKLPSVLSLLVSAGITGAGLAYYFYRGNEQKHRLNAMVAAHDSSLALT